MADTQTQRELIRTATPEELPSIMTVIDGAFLAIDADTVRERITEHAVLVALAASQILGVLVLDDNHIEAVAVRRRRRGQGIGTALVEAASDREGRLTAEFSPDVSPFYESLGFEIERTSDTRWRGIKRAEQ